jgi:hypothetical protein
MRKPFRAQTRRTRKKAYSCEFATPAPTADPPQLRICLQRFQPLRVVPNLSTALATMTRAITR